MFRCAKLIERQIKKDNCIGFVTVLSAFYRSSIGKKMIVALTGVILMLFVIGHLLGNLQIFLGPRWINDYAQHLRDLGPLLWIVRITLLIAVFLHIYFPLSFLLDNRRARPQRYRKRYYIKATYASRHTVVRGVIVLAFI